MVSTLASLGLSIEHSCKGTNHHCMSDLQFDWNEFSSFSTYK